ncbi:malonyl-[acyl-carrier protein] O-methyltransferase BioC [Guyparkeria sp. SCN-R1]|uniref:malonyl-ACP O-methyltransferase BioC n=1 Tax=Guyparkeria sp. SCN-R1 TaxID=2341113 RepID=UPI000F64CC5C|nr:malonyl-ACP O-methyltransferase BioC [Guyparkeria sp. SCN-R1]RRQ20368.1 malonyl-[acyl-carrier protein] O-methyltransferase BioC [Guyparkeria sp. SCN-R1]
MSALPSFDLRRVRDRFNRAAADYDRHAAVQREIGRRLDERFGWLKLDPARILDLGSGTGQMVRAMRQRYPQADVVGLDLAENMLRCLPRRRWWSPHRAAVVADMHALPFVGGSMDAVLSNFAVQWSDRPDVLFGEVARVCASGTPFAFTTLGPDSLQEIRRAWAEVDPSPHVHQFLDMHDLGDALVSAMLADPVMDRETLTVTYPTVDALLADLRGVGVGNAQTGRSAGMTGPRAWRRFRDALADQAVDGRIPLTYEIVYGLAWGTGVSPVAAPAHGVVPAG